MEDLQLDSFTLKVIIDNNHVEIDVQPRENSDGVHFYFCEVKGEKISQLRQEGREWQQVWGNLQNHEIKQIGFQIEEHLAVK